MENRRLLVLDTETTGLDLENGDRVIEIGIIELIDGVKTGHNFQRYFNPNKKIEKSAQDIHGLTNEFLSDKPNFYEIADEFEVNYIIKGNGDEYKQLDIVNESGFSFILPVNFPKSYDVSNPEEAENVSLAKLKDWELAHLQILIYKFEIFYIK